MHARTCQRDQRVRHRMRLQETGGWSDPAGRRRNGCEPGGILAHRRHVDGHGCWPRGRLSHDPGWKGMARQRVVSTRGTARLRGP
jgi:hypothetical protein